MNKREIKARLKEIQAVRTGLIAEKNKLETEFRAFMATVHPWKPRQSIEATYDRRTITGVIELVDYFAADGGFVLHVRPLLKRPNRGRVYARERVILTERNKPKLITSQ